jgi:hypothetical protein
VGIRHVDLVERDDPRATRQAAIHQVVVRRELGLDRLEIGQRVAAGLDRRAVHDVHQHRAPLDVAKELQAKPAASARPGHEPRDIRDGEDDVARLDDAEVGHERGEGVVGDLGLRSRHRRDQRGLAGIREADQRDVGDGLQL